MAVHLPKLQFEAVVREIEPNSEIGTILVTLIRIHLMEIGYESSSTLTEKVFQQ